MFSKNALWGKYNNNVFCSQEKNRSPTVTSPKFLYNIFAEQITQGVCFLSENHDKLLIGSCNERKLLVFNSTGHYLSKVFVNESQLIGAVWSLNGNIVYAFAYPPYNVIVESSFGVIVKHILPGNPSGLSISMDGIILLATQYHGIFQSDNNGLTWRLLFKPGTDSCLKVFKVPNGPEDNYWILERYGIPTLNYFIIEHISQHTYHNRLRVCTSKRKASLNEMLCAEVSLPLICLDESKSVDKYDCPKKISLLYVGEGNLLFSHNVKTAVFLLSGSPTRPRVLKKLLSLADIDTPYCMAYSEKRRYLYVGQEYGKVGVFQIK